MSALKYAVKSVEFNEYGGLTKIEFYDVVSISAAELAVFFREYERAKFRKEEPDSEHRDTLIAPNINGTP